MRIGVELVYGVDSVFHRAGKAAAKSKAGSMKKKAAKVDSDIEIIEYVRLQGIVHGSFMLIACQRRQVKV